MNPIYHPQVSGQYKYSVMVENFDREGSRIFNNFRVCFPGIIYLEIDNSRFFWTTPIGSRFEFRSY